MGAILLVAGLCVLIPFTAEDRGREAWLFAGLLAAVELVWAIAAGMRTRDRSPQVVIDRDRIFVRPWLLGTVQGESIIYILHSNRVRRRLIDSLARSRRQP